MGFLSPSMPKDPEAAPIPSPDDDAIRAAGDGERKRRARRRGGLATLLSGFETQSGGAGGYRPTAGGA